jgi:hypothetical protein
VEIDGSAVRKCNHFATQCHKLTLAAYLYLWSTLYLEINFYELRELFNQRMLVTLNKWEIKILKWTFIK